MFKGWRRLCGNASAKFEKYASDIDKLFYRWSRILTPQPSHYPDWRTVPAWNMALKDSAEY